MRGDEPQGGAAVLFGGVPLLVDRIAIFQIRTLNGAICAKLRRATLPGERSRFSRSMSLAARMKEGRGIGAGTGESAIAASCESSGRVSYSRVLPAFWRRGADDLAR